MRFRKGEASPTQVAYSTTSQSSFARVKLRSLSSRSDHNPFILKYTLQHLLNSNLRDQN